jgi:hypothetical protein
MWLARANRARATEAIEAAEAVSDAPYGTIVDVHPDAPGEEPHDAGE